MRTKRKEPEIVHRIRPHHGMCLYFFEGKGYSNTFSEHMAQVKEELLQNNGEAEKIKHFHLHIIPTYTIVPDKTVEEMYKLITEEK